MEAVITYGQAGVAADFQEARAALSAGKNIAGIYGTTNWNWSLQDEGSKQFVKSFGAKYGFPPSQAAHTCYVQTLLYADAVQRAGSHDPCAVGEALEGFEFDGLGNGKTLYRAEDHQCFKDVLVVRGKENPTSEFDLLEIVEYEKTPAHVDEADHRRVLPEVLAGIDLDTGVSVAGALTFDQLAFD